MNQYHVMLVDDEEEVIQAIKRKLNWEEMGFFSPVYAHNGLEALEMAEERRPDIVMTDIHMPYMDGLELGRRLKELYPNIRIIIFSGFDEFEYAKEAIRLEVDEYILKPIDAEELSKLFAKIHGILDRQLDEKRNVEKLTAYYRQSLPMMKESFCVSLMEGEITEQQKSNFPEFAEDFRGPVYCVGILHVSMTEIPENMTFPLLTVSVQKLAEERLLSPWNGQMFSHRGSNVVIFQMTDASPTKLTNDCDGFCRLAASVCDARVTVGLGRCVTRLEDLAESYRGARDAVSYRTIYGSGQAINITEVVPQTAGMQASFNGELAGVFHSIKVDGREDVEKKAQSYMQHGIKEQENLFCQRFFLMRVISELFYFLKEHRIAPEQVFSDMEQDVYARAQQMEPEELTQWFVTACCNLRESLKEKRSDSTRSFVGQAIDYVHAHYDDRDLSTDEICSRLGLSNAYFSTVFKKNTGKSFVGFLTDYRMEIALDLLMNQDEKTYIIAEKVGYADPNYFSYVFKKQFGMSPSKYKAEHMNA